MILKTSELDNGESEFMVMMKGAPEALISRCSFILTPEGEVPLEVKESNRFHVSTYNISCSR